MRPPICGLCDVRFGPEQGGLVSFAATAESRAWHARAGATPGFTGHPPEQEWFCGAHVARARELSEGTLGEALRVMRAEQAPA